MHSSHDLAESRSLALHQAVAARLIKDKDPAIVRGARQRVLERLRSGVTSREYAERWLSLLDGTPEELIAAMTDVSEQGAALRQTTPFSFVIGPRERWRIWREVRADWERWCRSATPTPEGPPGCVWKCTTCS